MRKRNAARAAVLALALAAGAIAAVTVASPPVGAGDDTPPGADAFLGVVKAWQARDAAAVAARVPAEGRLTLNLEGTGDGRIVSRATKANAQAILKTYFEKVESASLKDAAAADVKTFTRPYDYTYRPRGADERTTRLSFTLEKAADGSYALIAADERPKKK